MENPIASADDYLFYVQNMLAEASREIEAAATTPFNSTQETELLGARLGAALNALTRAQRDLSAHVKREQLREDRSDAVRSFKKFLGDDDGTGEKLVIAVLPLPLEDERLPLTVLKSQSFNSDFQFRITRFNNAERRNRTTFLWEMPGVQGYEVANEHYRFTTAPLDGDRETETADLYTTGAFVFKRSFRPFTTPNLFSVDRVTDYLDGTLRFVWRLYEDLHIGPRALAVQVALLDGAHLGLAIPDRDDRSAGAREEDPGVPLIFPQAPLVIRFPLDDASVGTAKARVAESISSFSAS